MNVAVTGGSSAAIAAAAIAQAVKASGAIVSVEAREFVKIVSRIEKPLIVVAEYGVFKKGTTYLTSYRGLIFFTKSRIFTKFRDFRKKSDFAKILDFAKISMDFKSISRLNFSRS